MRLPLGLDLKSVIVGIVLAYFVLPMLLRLVSARKATPVAK